MDQDKYVLFHSYLFALLGLEHGEEVYHAAASGKERLAEQVVSFFLYSHREHAKIRQVKEKGK